MNQVILAVRRAYVPVAAIALVLLVGNWLANTYAFDPLTAAQNQRIRFQKGGDLSSTRGGLTAREVELAEGVIEEKSPTPGDQVELLYVGNSQVLAIMDGQPGDIITPQWLQILLAREYGPGRKEIDVRLAAFPNLTLTELVIKLVAAGERSPRKPDILLAAAILEEFRGLGVRDEIASALESPITRAGLTGVLDGNPDLPAARKAIEPFMNSASKASAIAGDTSSASFAAAVERRLQASAERAPLFAKRQNLHVALNLTYNAWRDRLLGITSSAARPVPAASYQASLELLEMALRYARSKNIQTVFYLAPMRLGVQPNPNLPAAVTRFRRDVPELCRRYGALCLDYVDLIPEALWTSYPDDGGGLTAQRDFAHFTGAAHKLLAERLVTDIGGHLTRTTEQKRSPQP